MMKDGIAEVTNKNGSKNFITSKGKLVFKEGITDIDSFESIESGKYIIFVNDDYKYNVSNSKGNFVFKDWLDYKIEQYKDGVLKIGVNILVDYNGKIVSVI